MANKLHETSLPNVSLGSVDQLPTQITVVL